MKLSTKARYGARAMIELALAYPERSVAVREIASKQNLSAKYLEQILSPLKAAGLVRSVRGMRGGYALARPPAEINLYDIYEAVEGRLNLVECIGAKGKVCDQEAFCPTRETWQEMASAMVEILSRTTLEQLLERRRRKAAEVGANYVI